MKRYGASGKIHIFLCVTKQLFVKILFASYSKIPFKC